MFDRIVGRARGDPRRQSDGRGGSGGGVRGSTGGAAGGTGIAGAASRENGSGGRVGAASSGRMAGGIRGSGSRVPAQQGGVEVAPPPVTKPNIPPPAYSSLPRPREPPINSGLSPTFGAPGGKVAGQGRSMGVRGQRRDGNVGGVPEESASSGRIVQGRSSLEARNRGSGRWEEVVAARGRKNKHEPFTFFWCWSAGFFIQTRTRVEVCS